MTDGVGPAGTCGLVVLAAGAGTRFHGSSHKLLADTGGTELWRRAVGAAVAAAAGPVVVVTGAVELADPAIPGVTMIHARQWQDGQAASLRAALDHPAAAGWSAAIIGLADQPGIGPEAWRAVAAADPSAAIVVARYAGRRGPHPVRLARRLWALLPGTGEVVARQLITAHPEWVVDVDCVGSGEDIDTVEELGRWSNW